MPKSLLRAALILLLAAAVPLQGYAAASVGICRAFTHHDDEAAVTADRNAHHGDGHVHASSGHEKQGTSDGSSAQDPHHCAACASCGVAAAISASPVLLTADTPHRGVVIDSLFAPKGHVPEGLDRPPLTLLV
jgi:hypothetical protein